MAKSARAVRMHAWKPNALPEAKVIVPRQSVFDKNNSYLFKYWLLRFMDKREVELTS